MVERGLAERGIVITSANGTHALYTHTLATLYARSRKTHTQALIRTIYTYAGRGSQCTSGSADVLRGLYPMKQATVHGVPTLSYYEAHCTWS